MRLYTIGHSTRILDDLVAALQSFGVQLLVDIRTVPRSRHAPQFNRDALSRHLPRRGIRYRHMAGLGGLRKPRADSTNTAWRNAGFRGFADYMETPEFPAALEELRTLAQDEGPAAIMCAEAVPWRCHRSLVADALTARGDEVLHIMGPGKAHLHALTPWAQVDGGRVSYPGAPDHVSGGRSVVPGSRAPAVGRRPGRRSSPRAEQKPLL
ncbi:MAG: DUF488 domain-containing protein [Bacillati bacterium ANGP1]|uniref:DUF488 domain-containing protein n=1 Tax=Candidatus Segetimicrobium genomatis TaxID=2569760 RepID=A0A537LMH3_9BACT|nr:MAG: DUF488 domain-containing protein [Terrabacteria group bacterium ANGP1]